MKHLSFLFASILLLFTQTIQAQKTHALFNGTNLKGWYAFQDETGKHENAEEVFVVENGIIRMFGTKSAYLMSEKTFDNFILTLEFRWNTDSSLPRRIEEKNSGVMYRVPNDTPDMLWPQGIQFQVKEGSTGDFILLQNVALTVRGKAIKPGASVVVPRFSVSDAENPVNAWNKIEIVCKNGTVIHKLNGKTVNKGKNSSVRQGRILLQYEGFPIDFRNVQIKPLRKFLWWWY